MCCGQNACHDDASLGRSRCQGPKESMGIPSCFPHGFPTKPWPAQVGTGSKRRGPREAQSVGSFQVLKPRSWQQSAAPCAVLLRPGGVTNFRVPSLAACDQKSRLSMRGSPRSAQSSAMFERFFLNSLVVLAAIMCGNRPRNLPPLRGNEEYVVHLSIPRSHLLSQDVAFRQPPKGR